MTGIPLPIWPHAHLLPLFYNWFQIFFRLAWFLWKLIEMHLKYSLFQTKKHTNILTDTSLAQQQIKWTWNLFDSWSRKSADWFWQQKSQQIWVSALAEIFCHRGRNMRQNLAELDLGAQFWLKYEAGLRLRYERKWKYVTKCALTNPRKNSLNGKRNHFLLIKGLQKIGRIARMGNERERAEGYKLAIKPGWNHSSKCQATHLTSTKPLQKVAWEIYPFFSVAKESWPTNI